MLNTNKMSAIAGIAAVLLLPLTLALANSKTSTGENLERSTLFAALASAKSELEGRVAEDAIWSYWFDQSPSAEIRALLEAGMERRKAYDYEAAEIHLDKVVDAAPDYAEGYNQRAFVRFLRENYSDAQADLGTVLELEPDHFGAMSGLFHMLNLQNRQEAAWGWLQKAVSIHPWLKERFALPESLWPKSYREIHRHELEI